ncbi:unnamed protein product [Acidithrix sp. C25]|nr:unnamed protein product [Acidithrix sp. C25]
MGGVESPVSSRSNLGEMGGEHAILCRSTPPHHRRGQLPDDAE